VSRVLLEKFKKLASGLATTQNPPDRNMSPRAANAKWKPSRMSLTLPHYINLQNPNGWPAPCNKSQAQQGPAIPARIISADERVVLVPNVFLVAHFAFRHQSLTPFSLPLMGGERCVWYCLVAQRFSP
jgi:hypothetical protein